MNHQITYKNIIESAIKQKRTKHNGVYYESHHIIPRCLGGSNEKDNRVLLTGREHYIIHKLLTYIYPKNKKIAYAFWLMTIEKRKDHNVSSRDYAYAKEHNSSIPMSEETKEKMKDAWKIRKIPIIIKNNIFNQQLLNFKIEHLLNKQKEVNEKKVLKELERQKHFNQKPLHSKLYQAV